MTKIDRYILVIFLRTVLVCFCSIAGIFIVFHAFTSMDTIVEQAQGKSIVLALARFYGPYMLLLFDWTGAIIILMALLFTVGWLRFTGELTAVLSAGVSHGRILRPMVIASALLVGFQLCSRELILPRFGDALSINSKKMRSDRQQRIAARYDRINQVLVDGLALKPKTGEIVEPSFHLDSDYPGFGEVLLAKSALWHPAEGSRPSGYLLDAVKQPDDIDRLESVNFRGRPILMTSRDHEWLGPGQCFFATAVDAAMLQNSEPRTASVRQLVRRVRNPAVRSSERLQVILHERIVRPPLDFALILLGLPLVVNRKGQNIFVMIAAAMLTVLGFFVLKTISGTLASNGYLLSPAMAAWVPLLILCPVAYVRFRDVQLV